MQATVDANPAALESVANVEVQAYEWGEPTQFCGGYDLVLGSDVAYGEQSYDPLLKSLQDCTTAGGVVLLGVTMMDTRPHFFDKVIHEGWMYQKLSDHLLDQDFRGTTFGVFMLQRQVQQRKAKISSANAMDTLSC